MGWFIEENQAKFVFPEPQPLFKSRNKALSNRAVQACPAVNEYERDLFVINNPFDIRLRCIKKGDTYDLHIVEQGTRIDDDLRTMITTNENLGTFKEVQGIFDDRIANKLTESFVTRVLVGANKRVRAK